MSEEIKSSIRARLGAFIATISVLTAAGVVLFHEVDLLRPYLTHSMIAMGFAGVGAVIQGQVRRQQANSEEEVLRFYFDPAYWGRSMIVSAALTYLVATFFFAEEQPITRIIAKEQTAKEVVVAVDEEPAGVAKEQEPEFPDLTLTGVVLNGEKSTALIDGYTVQKGEFVKGVQLVEVSEAGVVVELGGEFRTILRKGLKHGNTN